MRIVMYGKINCGNCATAEKHLQKMGVRYNKIDFEGVMNGEAGGDRDLVEAIEASAEYIMGDEFLPVFVVDGVGMSYARTMKYIKAKLKERKDGEENKQ